MVLEDLVSRPSILSRFGVMDVLPIAEDLTLSTVERPNEDDFVLASTASRSRGSTRNGGGIGDSKFESDLFLGKTKGLGSIFDRVVDLVWAKDVRHGCFRNIRERTRFLEMISRPPFIFKRKQETTVLYKV